MSYDGPFQEGKHPSFHSWYYSARCLCNTGIASSPHLGKVVSAVAFMVNLLPAANLPSCNKVAYFANDTNTHSEIIASNNIYFIFPKKIDAYYLAAFLDSVEGKKELEKHATGNVIKTISISSLNFEVTVPRFSPEKEKEIANKYKDYLENITKSKNQLKQLIMEKENLFQK